MPISIRTEIIDLHQGLEHLNILHLSDIHLWWSGRVLEEIEQIIVEAAPGLLVFTGDYYDLPKGARLFSDFLKHISTHYPGVFIRGNHDFIYGRKTAGLIERIPGCHCVENRLHQFRSDTGRIYNITSWQQRHSLHKNPGEKNIVLIHNPEKLVPSEMREIDLILAGHLHGGQLILSSSAEKGHFPGNLFYKYCTDRTQINNTSLIVSKGIRDTFPLRINCPREIVQVKIV